MMSSQVSNLVADKSLLLEARDELTGVFACVLGNILGFIPQFFYDFLHPVLSVEVLPDEDPRGVEAEGVARVGVEEDRPVVEFLAQDDQRVGDGILLFHGFCSFVQ